MAFQKNVNCVLAEKPRAMLDHSVLKFSYWCEAIRHATDRHDCPVNSELRVKTSMEAVLRPVPNNSMPRVLGCAACVRKHKKLSGQIPR